MKCKNCNSPIDGNFCAQCGQNTKIDKLNLSSFLTELSDSVFQINKGLFYTIKSLFIKPGYSIREFLNGQRKEHFKPIAFVLALSTVYFFVSRLSDSPTLIDDFLSGVTNAEKDHNVQAIESSVVKWLSNNYAYTTLLLLPVFSLASYISFLRLGRNYLEHIVINAYVTGIQALFYSFFMVIGVILNKEDITVLIAVIISIFFNFWAFSQFFDNKKKGLIFLRLLLTYILFFLFFLIILFAIIYPSLEH